MINALQKKFTVTAMIAVTVLLAVLLGAINLANALSLSAESDRLLESLAMQEGMGPAPRLEDLEPRRGFFQEPMTEDSRMAAVYFVVRLTPEGELLGTDLRRIASVDEEEAAALAQRLLAEERGRGREGTLKFQRVETSYDCWSYVFLDVSSRRYAVLRVAGLSLIGGLLAWGAMLVLVRALSRRAIRPIAENMQRQRQFVTDAGHELKTPLAIIQANTEAMELMGGDSKYSRNIREQVRRLTGLTQNLLTLARLDEAQRPRETAPLDLSALAEESLAMFREPAALKGAALEAAVAPGITVRGERQQLAQLLSILLDNAVKYCPAGGTIRLSLEREGERALLRAANTVSERDGDPERFFDRFYRADASRSQKSGGFGIGLSAARAIVEGHGGSIRAAYAGEDIVFTVKL